MGGEGLREHEAVSVLSWYCKSWYGKIFKSPVSADSTNVHTNVVVGSNVCRLHFACCKYICTV